MFAADVGGADMVQLLMEKGADVNVKEKTGNTALRLASLKHHDQVVELLRAYGATE
jgi:ankyrin repeat protein